MAEQKQYFVVFMTFYWNRLQWEQELEIIISKSVFFFVEWNKFKLNLERQT